MVRRFGLAGHGVVGSLFARLLRANGGDVASYDVLLDHAETAEAERLKITGDGARPATLAEMVSASDYVLAVPPTQASRPAAVAASRYLRPGQVYCDFASSSPAVKREIASIVNATGAEFVEGAILGAVGASLACPRILLGGTAAATTAEVLNDYGIRAHFYSPEIGPASAFKMIRSVFSKGMETLLIETLRSARRADVMDEIWAEIVETLAPDKMERMLETWVRSHAVSSGRRYHEMIEVSRYLEELEVPPVVTQAAAEVFRRSNGLGIAAAFQTEPERFIDVIDFLNRPRKRE